MKTPRLLSEKDGLRTYEVVEAKDWKGIIRKMQLCEEWIEGRWEPFYSLR
jgi:hypothetical protein